MKCIKCGMVVSSRRKGLEDYICRDCRVHEEAIRTLYEEAKSTFSDHSKSIEKTEIFELLKNMYFIVQKNPKLSVYSAIVKELLEEFAVRGKSEIDYDELWRRTKSSRNILKILQSMEDADIIKIESPDKIKRIVKPSTILKRFIEEAYKPYRTQEQAKIRVAAVLTMYVILHEMYMLANAKSQDEILRQFGSHTPKAPWVATMFLWTERIRGDSAKKEFNEEEIRKFFTKRNLSPTTISNYIAALKATSPHSLQQYIENIQPSGNNVRFIVREELIQTLERIYGERVREVDRT